VDLPLYVLEDPDSIDTSGDRGRTHALQHALETIAEAFQSGEGSTVALAEPPHATRVDRSSLILRRFLLVRPDEAVARFDDWFAHAPSVAHVGKGTWRGAVDAANLAVDDGAANRLRRAEGRLRLRASPVAVPVVLEMLPWYCSRVVLDLRPADLSKRMAWLRRETFFFTAHALLSDLRKHLEIVRSG
jgi:hypothetical protein